MPSPKRLFERAVASWKQDQEMGRRARLPTLARLELSQAAYDEIERKLLDAGHEHRFWRGPGTAIDMTGIWVERETVMAGRHSFADLRAQLPKDRHYCFGCDRVVTQPCERVDCMEAAREAVSHG
jgi:hypothetical protein